MKNKILYVLVGVLVLFSLFNTASNIQSSESLKNIRLTIESMPKDPVVYVGKDGYTPRKGIDYNDGKNGANGLNSISFVTTETVVKEVPLIGLQGEKGIDAAELQIRINPDSSDIETKYSNQRFWSPLVVCSNYRLVCPDAN